MCRDNEGVAINGGPLLDSLIRDGRHAGRMLLKNPGFALTAVAILGLGIGANASIFSVVNAVVLRPLPFPDSSRLVDVWHTPPREQFAGRPTFSVSPANYLDWRAQSIVFEHMAIYGFRPANLTGRGEPDPLQGVVVSGEYLSGAPRNGGRRAAARRGRRGSRTITRRRPRRARLEQPVWGGSNRRRPFDSIEWRALHRGRGDAATATVSGLGRRVAAPRVDARGARCPREPQLPGGRATRSGRGPAARAIGTDDNLTAA